ncbi:hypothetical protein [Polaribacter cellanae]|uniref:Uncharacterized protein n=1 Tax=Polaribacter cellanae TaxID=2818493 RepID=A0A975CMQ9_9FLAO|nr:hypothetical protein [Polaribacter cellanae]QTE22776.1 hypothetical protein J3359_00400 [Polaribacter cellanae]
MKFLLLPVLIASFLTTSIFSQTTPKKPKTPSTSTSKSTSYSITFDTDSKEENSSVSIKALS